MVTGARSLSEAMLRSIGAIGARVSLAKLSAEGFGSSVVPRLSKPIARAAL